MTPVGCPYGNVLLLLPYRAIFSGFVNLLLFMSAQVFVSAQNPPNIILNSNCSITGSQGAILKVIGTAILFYSSSKLYGLTPLVTHLPGH